MARSSAICSPRLCLFLNETTSHLQAALILSLYQTCPYSGNCKDSDFYMLCAGGKLDACLGQSIQRDLNDGTNERSTIADASVRDGRFDSSHESTNEIIIVQATHDILEQNTKSSWSRTRIQAPSRLPLQMVEWALVPWKEFMQCEVHCTRFQRQFAVWTTYARVGIVLVPLQSMFLSQGLLSGPVIAPTLGPPCWPRYTRNALEMRSKGPVRAVVDESRKTITGATKLFKATRLIFPQRLIMYADRSWIPVKDPPSDVEYVFISWHWASFGYDRPKTRREALALVTSMAQNATLDAGLKAYWLDVQCIINDKHQPPNTFSRDVYGMSDFVRNAHHVAILLPNEHSYYKRAWSRRLWTLPEGLLANGNLRIWTDMKTSKTQYVKEELDRVQMTCEFWKPFENDDRQYPTRILAEYYENRIELSRLEMVITAIAALSKQESSNFTQADIAYALMGLMRTKIVANKEDTLFQAMTKLLSLTDNNEYVIERMISSYPYPVRHSRDLFMKLLHKDQFDTYIWDIWAKCEVVGIDEQDGIVFLNDCRTLPINHQSLPSNRTKTMDKIQPFLQPAVLFLGFLLLIATTFCAKYTVTIYVSFLWTVFLAVALPTLSRKTFDNEDFVLIEGALPLSQLEIVVFGHTTKTLTYAMSSSPLTTPHNGHDPPWLEAANLHRWIHELYSARDSGSEPDWIETPRHDISPTSPPGSPTSPKSPISFLRRSSSSIQQKQEQHHPPLLPGHILFTLLHVPSGKVSLIQARRPPTTVLLAGAEGGMLRAVLCSSTRDCNGVKILYKETVVRLGMDLWERGTPRSWLRVGMLGSERWD